MAPKLHDAYKRKDWTELHTLAHRLKGASGYIAGERVNTAAHHLQKLAARLMPADPKSSVAEAANAFVSAEDNSAQAKLPVPSEKLVGASIKALTRCLDELVEEIKRNHTP
jgi:HPt (histidine-containing phosphotransfer) domain-containing protein